jgi:hypothetical protein
MCQKPRFVNTQTRKQALQGKLVNKLIMQQEAY